MCSMNFSHRKGKNVNNMSKHVEQLVWVGALGLLIFLIYFNTT